MTLDNNSHENNDANPASGDGYGPLLTRRSRVRRRAVVSVLVSLCLLWLTAVAVDVLLAARHVHQGADQIQVAHDTLSADGLLAGAPVTPLQSAETNFTAGYSLLSSPLLWPVDILPVFGRQLRSLQDLALAAGQVSRIGVSTVAESRSLLNLPHTAGPDRIATLERLSSLATTTHASLSKVDMGPSAALFSPLAHQRDKFASELDSVQTTLSRTASASAAAATILQGPQQYLLLAANNAEMRSGSGAFLEAGTVSTGSGELHLSGMTPTPALSLPKGAVSVGGDLQARWGWLLPGVDWRNLGLTPQFDVNGALAAQMWRAKTGQQVNGVMALDVAGLKDLLDVTGPVVTANGTEVSADSVEQLLLHDQYAGEGYSSDPSQPDQIARVDELGSLAGSVMHALEDQPLDLHKMVDALSSATAGRDLLLWSADPATEDIWRSTGVSGQLGSDSMMASVINRGGNKLDQYLAVNTSMHLSSSGGGTVGKLTITLANFTPPGQSPYIAGPYPGLGTHYGEYVGIVAVNLPGDVRNVTLGVGESTAVDGPEGSTLLVGVNVDLLPETSRQVTINFSLPQTHGSLTVLPSARVPAGSWNVDGGNFTADKPHAVVW